MNFLTRSSRNGRCLGCVLVLWLVSFLVSPFAQNNQPVRLKTLLHEGAPKSGLEVTLEIGGASGIREGDIGLDAPRLPLCRMLNSTVVVSDQSLA